MPGAYSLLSVRLKVHFGVPSGLSSFSYALFGTVVVKLIAVYGTGAVALFGMAQKILRFGHMLIAGLGLGSGALVGQHLGGGRLERAWLATVVSMRLGAGFLTAFGIGIAVFAPDLVAFFFADPELHGPGVLYLRLMTIGLPFIGITMAVENSFSGAGLNTPPMVVQVFAAWGVTVPGMFLLGQTLGRGAPGAMVGIAGGEVVGALLSLAMIRRGTWLSHRI